MVWVGVLVGLIIGLSLGVVITCTIVFDRVIEDMESGDRGHDNI